MILKALRWLAARLSCRDIVNAEGVVYMSRYRIFGWMPRSTWWPRSLPSLYLHHIRRPDEDEAPHNHPWAWAWAIVLSGGYTEERPVAVIHPFVAQGYRIAPKVRTLRPGGVNRIRHGDYHRISAVAPECWTLILCGPKRSSWGFLVPGRGHVGWRERLEERGIAPAY